MGSLNNSDSFFSQVWRLGVQDPGVRSPFFWGLSPWLVDAHLLLPVLFSFLATLGLCCCTWAPLVAVSGGYSSLWCTGFLLQWRLLLQLSSSRAQVHGLWCCAASGIFPDQGSNPCLLHCRWIPPGKPPPWVFRESSRSLSSVCICVLISSSYKDTRCIGLGPALMASFSLH